MARKMFNDIYTLFIVQIITTFFLGTPAPNPSKNEKIIQALSILVFLQIRFFAKKRYDYLCSLLEEKLQIHTRNMWRHD